MEAKALVIQFAATLAEIEAKTIGGTLRYVEVEALVDRTADTLQEESVRIMATYKAMQREVAVEGRGTTRHARSHASRNGVRKIWRQSGRCGRRRLHDTTLKGEHTCRLRDVTDFFPRFSRSKFIDSLPGLFRIARILVKTILIIGLLG